jgi:hypothetical protein
MLSFNAACRFAESYFMLSVLVLSVISGEVFKCSIVKLSVANY